MSAFFCYLLLVAGVVLQTTVAKCLVLFHVAPNLVLVLVVCVGLTHPPLRAAIFGAVAGLVLDMTSGAALGLQTILMLYVGVGVSYFGSRFFRGNVYAAMFCAFVITVIYEFVYGFFTLFIFGHSGLGTLLLVVAKEAIYHTAVAVPLYFLVRTIAWIDGGKDGI